MTAVARGGGGVPSDDAARGDQGGVVHVVEFVDGDGAALLGMIASVGRRLGVVPAIVVVGPERAARRAASLGCLVLGRLCPPLRSPRLAARSIRFVVADACRRAPEATTLVVWGSASLAATVAPLLAEPEDRLLVPGRSRSMRWVALGEQTAQPERRARRLRGIDAVVLDASWIVPLGQRSPGVAVEFLPPWVDATAVGSLERTRPAPDRAALRARWQVGDATVVVGAVGPEPSWTDYRRAADIVGIAAVRGADVRLVGHPAMARAWRTQRWMDEVGLARNPLLVDEDADRPWAIAAGLDAALVLGDGVRTAGGEAIGRRSVAGPAGRLTTTPTIAGLWLAAAGVPLIVEEGALDPHLVGCDGDAPCPSLVRVDDPLRATRTLLHWVQSPGDRADAGRRAKAAVAEAELPGGWRRLLLADAAATAAS